MCLLIKHNEGVEGGLVINVCGSFSSERQRGREGESVSNAGMRSGEE